MAYRKNKNTLFSFISDELKTLRIPLSELNSKSKYKQLRTDLVERSFRRYLETEPKTSKEQTIKDIRKQSGLKFSNEVGRFHYNRLKNINTSVGYGARIRKDKLADISKIPKIDFHIRDLFGYGFNLYTQIKTGSNSKRKLRELPKSAERVQAGKYNHLDDYMMWSEILLSANDANAIMHLLVGKQMDILGDMRHAISGSDYQEILTNKDKKLIGFKYNRLVRT